MVCCDPRTSFYTAEIFNVLFSFLEVFLKTRRCIIQGLVYSVYLTNDMYRWMKFNQFKRFVQQGNRQDRLLVFKTYERFTANFCNFDAILSLDSMLEMWLKQNTVTIQRRSFDEYESAMK